MKKALKVGGAGFGGLVVLMALVGFYMYSTTSIPAALASAQQQSNVVYYSDGTTEIGTIGKTNRTDLSLSQMPTSLQDAFLAAEDKNFYHEGGVSYTGMMRAVGSDLLSSGGSLNGGSTITQEFVRNYYGLGLQQTATRKIKEIIISEKLAGVKSKQWILEHYLNMVFLGQNSYGVGAAAETYFGKPASKLTIAEDAVLAGLPQQPSTYPLPQYKASLQARWQYVLNQMVKDGYITQAQASAQKFPTLLTWADPTRGELASDINPADNNPWDYYVLSVVAKELNDSDHISQGDLNNGGYKVITNLNYGMQKQLYNAVNTILSPSNLQANGSHFAKLPLWALTGAEVQNPKNGEIVAMYPGKGINQSPSACEQSSCFEDTAHSTEQVGSSFKPYVVAAAVKQGMNVQTSTMDTSSYACIAPPSRGSTTFSQPVTKTIYQQATAAVGSTSPSPSSSTGCPAGYFPEENDAGESIGKPVAVGTGNYAGAIYSKDTVQDALAQSSNVAFTDLIHKTGTVDPETIAEQVGTKPSAFSGNLGKEVGVALGEAPMSVENQASLVAMLADNGTYHTAHLVKSWSNASAGVAGKPRVPSTEVLTPAQASQVQYAMEMTTVNGTAKGLVSLSQQGRQVIGKTGTTTSNHSGFFIGAIPQYAMAVGMFTQSLSDKSQNLGMLDSSNAANMYPTMIWNSFMNAAAANTTPQNFLPLDTTGTTAWNMFPALPKPPKPKPQPKKNNNQNPFCFGGGLFGGGGKGHGNGGNCQSNSPTPTPTPTPTTPSQCSGLFTCPSTNPTPSASASASASSSTGKPGG